jgi:hypothetical protein
MIYLIDWNTNHVCFRIREQGSDTPLLLARRIEIDVAGNMEAHGHEGAYIVKGEIDWMGHDPQTDTIARVVAIIPEGAH